MANGRFVLGKQSGGTLGLVFPDGIGNTEVLLPESGNLASVGTEVTDNAIARYDGTTGKLQNSSVRIDDNGNLLLTSGTGALGYGAGAGGIVTQLTGKSTAVTLNKPSGTIITSNSALISGAMTYFVVNNSLVTNADTIIVNCNNGNHQVNAYSYQTNGTFIVHITNIADVPLSDVVYIGFTIIKGAHS